MNTLERIVSNKRLEVAGRKLVIPPKHLVANLDIYPVRDFAAALSGGRRIISEVKRRSPATRSYRKDIDLVGLARAYEQSGAAAISVVTDVTNFGTSLSDARLIRETVEIPLLVKDFIVDPYQVYEARAFGADAVLLIARICDPPTLTSLVSLTHTLGMAALVEAHDEEDLWKAHESGAGIVGINNRDLDSLEVSLDVTRTLLEKVPNGSIVVSESGISSRTEIDELSVLGVDAFLIGSALLRSANPARLLRELAGTASVAREWPSSHQNLA
jgi:indole-3-glycerol phosphate synthase